jgi:hypothetical protein
LSNRQELINLKGALGRESGLPEAATARLRKAGDRPIFEPIDPDGSGWLEYAIWSGGKPRWLRQESIQWPPPGFPWDIERVYHVAIDFQH